MEGVVRKAAADAAPSGLGVPCYEAQADGVPCDQLKSDCADCDKVRPAPPDEPVR